MKQKGVRKHWNLIVSILQSIFLLIVASGIGLLFQAWNFKESNIVIVYLLAVALSAKYGNGHVAGLFSAVASTFLFNYFFTQPYYSLNVNEAGYLVTFLIMTCVSFIISTLTVQMKQSAKIAQKNADEKQVLLELMVELNHAKDMEDVAKRSIVSFNKYLHIDVGCIHLDEQGVLKDTYLQKSETGFVYKEIAEYDDLFLFLKDYDKPYFVTEGFYEFLIKGSKEVLGIMRIPIQNSFILDNNILQVLTSMLDCIALAMERIQADAKHLKFKEEANAQRYRANLLRAISHDLRTPLAGIMGTCEMLKKMLDDKEKEYELTDGIYKDAQWLYSLVENILSLTKLQEGKMQMSCQSESMDEIVGVALYQFEKRSEREVKVQLPDDIVIVDADAKLLEQVILNLLDNANKHTPKDKSISIYVSCSKTEVKVCVEDEGEGIAEQDISRIFEMFYTTSSKHSDASMGIGLGLTICKSIIEAHGGSIYAENREDGDGARFSFVIPRKENVYVE